MTTLPFSPAKYLSAFRDLTLMVDTDSIDKAMVLIKDTADAGKKIFVCGNGGSAMSASHYITDWNKMYNLATGRTFRGISLCDNVGLITAYGNDLSFEEIFSGQLKSVLDPGDLVIAVSGSGNSGNVVKAVEYANAHGATTIAVVGYDGGKLLSLAHYRVHVPCFDMQLCEDFHLMFGHMVMKFLCGSPIKD